MNLRILGLTTLLAVTLLVAVLGSCVSQGQGGGGTGITFFRHASFDFVFPETAPNPADVTQLLRLRVVAGETAGLGFGVRSGATLPEVALTVSDLQGPEGALLPASGIDCRVVQVWNQKERHFRSFETVRVCEGLLKDDALNLLDPQYTPLNLPSIPATAPVRTSLQAGRSKGFYLIFHVPPDLPAGAYRGVVRLGAAAAPAETPLEVQVLSYKLDPAGKALGMYYNDNLTEECPEPVYRARLQYMRSQGIDGLRLLPKRETFRRELEIIKELGFKGPISIWDENSIVLPRGHRLMKEYVTAMKDLGFDPYIYGVDEPNSDKVPPGQHHSYNGELMALKATRDLGALSMTALTLATDKRLMDENNEVLDFPLFTTVERHGLSAYIETLQTEGTRQRVHPKQGFYYGTWQEDPVVHRRMWGFLLAQSQLDGLFGWTFYSYHLGGQGQIFDDFGLEGDAKRWMTVYPTREGCSPTLQSEAQREGITDLRYLNTFLRVCKEQEGTQPARAAELQRKVMTAVGVYRVLGSTGPADQPAAQYNNRQFEDTRDLIIDATLQLLGK